jgi:RNA polymerase sigma-70 factor (sigma-E family)
LSPHGVDWLWIWGHSCKWIEALVRIRGVGLDQQDFTEFYRGSRDACLRAVVANVGDRHLAEDLVAEAFAGAWMGWPKVRRHPAPQAWVVRSALNTGVSWWRKRRRELPLADHDAPAPVEVGAGVDAALLDALRRLSPREREVVVLRVLLDLDGETTAKVLGIATGTVGAHLSRAVASMRASLPSPDAAEVEHVAQRGLSR